MPTVHVRAGCPVDRERTIQCLRHPPSNRPAQPLPLQTTHRSHTQMHAAWVSHMYGHSCDIMTSPCMHATAGNLPGPHGSRSTVTRATAQPGPPAHVRVPFHSHTPSPAQHNSSNAPVPPIPPPPQQPQKTSSDWAQWSAGSAACSSAGEPIRALITVFKCR